MKINSENEVMECLHFLHTGYCTKHSNYCTNLNCEVKDKLKKPKTDDDWKQILKDLAWRLCDYDVSYEIVENDDIENFDEDESENLKCPFALWLYISGSRYYLETEDDFGIMLYLNKNGDGLEFRYKDVNYSVEEPEWIFLAYCNELQKKILKLKDS